MEFDKSVISAMKAPVLVLFAVLIVVTVLSVLRGFKKGIKKSAVSFCANIIAILLSLIACKVFAPYITAKIDVPMLISASGIPESLMTDTVYFLVTAASSMVIFTLNYLIAYFLLRIPVYLVNKKLFSQTEFNPWEKWTGALVLTLNSLLFFGAFTGNFTALGDDIYKACDKTFTELNETHFSDSEIDSIISDLNEVKNLLGKTVIKTAYFKTANIFGGKFIYKITTSGKINGKKTSISEIAGSITDFAIVGIKAAHTATMVTQAIEALSDPESAADSVIAQRIIELQPETIEEVMAIPEIKEALNSMAGILATNESIIQFVNKDTISAVIDEMDFDINDIDDSDIEEVEVIITEIIDSYDGTDNEKELLKKNLNELVSFFGINLE